MHHVVVARQNAGEERGALLVGAVADEGGAHLPVGEPHGRDRRTRGDQFLTHDQAIDRWPAAATELLGPCHADPPVGGHLPGNVLREAVDPRVVVSPVERDGPVSELPGLFAQRDLCGRPGEIHRRRA